MEPTEKSMITWPSYPRHRFEADAQLCKTEAEAWFDDKTLMALERIILRASWFSFPQDPPEPEFKPRWPGHPNEPD